MNTPQTPQTAYTMAEIETAAYDLSKTRDQLSDIVSELQQKIEQLQRSKASQIKRLVEEMAQRHNHLHNMIDGSRAAFKQPRTQVFHGIKVGLKKGRGGIDFDDEQKVVSLIKKHFPKQQDVLIRTIEEPNIKAIEELAIDELKRIGCTVTGTEDVILIKPVDGLVEKFVNALLKSLSIEAETEQPPHHD